MYLMKPTKYTDLNLSIIAISGFLIPIFQKRRFVSYTELLSLLEKKYSISAHDVFLQTIDFLFLLGLVKYYPKTDSFEWLGK